MIMRAESAAAVDDRFRKSRRVKISFRSLGHGTTIRWAPRSGVPAFNNEGHACTEHE